VRSRGSSQRPAFQWLEKVWKFIEYNGGLKVNHSLLTVIVHD
jgi:hypothetical protein